MVIERVIEVKCQFISSMVRSGEMSFVIHRLFHSDSAVSASSIGNSSANLFLEQSLNNHTIRNLLFLIASSCPQTFRMSASEARVSLIGKLGLKPLNTHNILYYYAPIQGALSYTALSINVMNPSLVLRLDFFSFW